MVCQVVLGSLFVPLVAMVGCWSIAMWKALGGCVPGARCDRHTGRWQCLTWSYRRAFLEGVAGGAFGLIASDLLPSHDRACLGIILAVSGSLSLSSGRGRRITAALLRRIARGLIDKYVGPDHRRRGKDDA